MKSPEQWADLISRIMATGSALIDKMPITSQTPPSALIFSSLFQKGINTLRAIQLLYEAALPIQAQVLIRVIIEVRIDFEIFHRLWAQDPVYAARRVSDAMMLQKVKQQRESDFRGSDGTTRHELIQLENDLVQRYGRDLAARMRRHGFSGKSIGERARELGLDDLYHIFYRNFSRNVHATDYKEHISPQDMTISSRWPEYEDLRDDVALSTAIACMWQMSWLADEIIGGELDDKPRSIWMACSAFERWCGDLVLSDYMPETIPV